MYMYWFNMPQCNQGYKKSCSTLLRLMSRINHVQQEEGFVTSKHVRKPEIVFFTFEKLIIIFICLFSKQNLSTDGQTTEVRAAIHIASAGGREYLRTLEELLKAPDVSINIVNNYGRFCDFYKFRIPY